MRFTLTSKQGEWAPNLGIKRGDLAAGTARRYVANRDDDFGEPTSMLVELISTCAQPGLAPVRQAGVAAAAGSASPLRL